MTRFLALAAAASFAACTHPAAQRAGDGGATSGSSSGSASGGATSGSSTSGAASSGGSTSGSSTSGSSTSGNTYAGVLQRAGDASRDAVFVDPAFTKANVATLHLDPTFASATWHGPVFAQPLYFVDPATKKDLLIVVTERNEVVALDAANGSAVWRRTLAPPVTDGSTLACPGDISPLGVTGTPVIDPAARTLFVAGITPVAGKPHHEVWALHLDDGTPVSGWPVDMEGLTATSSAGATITFQSYDQNQRAALTLLGGVVYVPYGGLYGDCGPYHGWVAGIPETAPAAPKAWATDAIGCAFWAPGGLASDAAALYGATGNAIGRAEAAAWGGGEAVIRFGPGPTFSGKPADFYARSDYVSLDQADLDLGSTAPVLFDFDDPRAGLRHLIFIIGKTKDAILVDRESLGGIGGQISEPPVADGEVHGSLAAYRTAGGTYLVFNGPPNACPNDANAAGDATQIVALRVNPSTASSPVAASVAWCGSQGGFGAPIVTTPHGTDDVLVWGLGGTSNTPPRVTGTGALTAFDGDTGAVVFGDHGANLGAASIQQWVPPIVARGRLFVATDTRAYAFTP